VQRRLVRWLGVALALTLAIVPAGHQPQLPGGPGLVRVFDPGGHPGGP